MCSQRIAIGRIASIPRVYNRKHSGQPRPRFTYMIHEILPVGQLRCNCSIFGDEQSHEAIVIDPGDELSKIIEVLDEHRLKVKAIIITHGHIDHVAGAAKLRALTGAPVYMNEKDHALLEAL